MNLNVVNVVVFGIGAILVYAAVKDTDPRNVVRHALGQAPVAPPTGTKTSVPTSATNPAPSAPRAPVLSV